MKDDLSWLRQQVPDYATELKEKISPTEETIIDDLMIAIEENRQYQDGRATSLATFLATFRNAGGFYQAGADDAVRMVFGYTFLDMLTVANDWMKAHQKGGAK